MNEEARNRALRILEKREVSRKMLLDKLTEKGISPSDAEEVCERMVELGVVNDARFAGMVVRHYAGKGYGRRRIQEELYRRGIDKDLWEEALEECPDPEDTVYRLFCSRMRGAAPEKDNLRRTADFLLRRGYSHETVRRAAEQYISEYENEDEP